MADRPADSPLPPDGGKRPAALPAWMGSIPWPAWTGLPRAGALAGPQADAAAAGKRRSIHDDPEAFLLEIIGRADERLGTGAAEILGAVAGAALALIVPFAPGLLLRGVIGTAIGTIVGKKIAEHDPAWFRRRLELALERFEEINRFHREGRCMRRARDEYVDDLVERFFDKGDSLLE